MILAERAARVQAEAVAASAQGEAATAKADLSSRDALIAHLKLEIEKLRRSLYGTRSERKARLLEQMELQLEDLEAAATEDELAAQSAAARTQRVSSFERKRPSRKPFPEHLPRERVVIAATASACTRAARSARIIAWTIQRTHREEEVSGDCIRRWSSQAEIGHVSLMAGIALRPATSTSIAGSTAARRWYRTSWISLVAPCDCRWGRVFAAAMDC
jgi:Transposase C of IS166 homeodomain